ncbi:MAG: FISUMP domain-containing protein, partial [Bacteroidota bacterium]
KSKEGWFEGGYPSNESGFSALPAGFRRAIDGSFQGSGETGIWWTSTEYTDGVGAMAFYMYYKTDYFVEGDRRKTAGHSVRCLKD